MRRLIQGTVLLLVVLLIVLGLYHGLDREDVLPADGSSAALGLMLLEEDNGLYVLAVTRDSPAERAGIQPGDYLVLSGGEPLGDMAQMDALLSAGEEAIPLTLLRDGRELRVLLPTR